MIRYLLILVCLSLNCAGQKIQKDAPGTPQAITVKIAGESWGYNPGSICWEILKHPMTVSIHSPQPASERLGTPYFIQIEYVGNSQEFEQALDEIEGVIVKQD